MTCMDCLVPVPREVSRRAWECAFDLGQHHSSRFGPHVWHWLLSAVNRDPAMLTWEECAALFRLHRLDREAACHD